MDRNARTRRIWETILEIPAGNVASYGQIAEIAGIPRGARQTAYALRVAPDDLALPWYRVITASGKIAFEKGSASFRRQRDLLRNEGVTVNAGKVDMNEFRWQPDLDELLWKPTSAWDET
jgi:methylated-DNA-protein-cysteine methyltransferase-like protein